MLKGLKNFLMAGNVIDLAVGLVMGAAFEKVVHSFVGKGLMPLISLLLPGDLNLEDQKFILREGTHHAAEAAEHGTEAVHTAEAASHGAAAAAEGAGTAAHGAEHAIGLAHAGDPIAFGWGDIIQNIIEFALIGAAIYFVLIALGKKPVPPDLKRGDELLADIRDLLEKQVHGSGGTSGEHHT